jgi:hypothetical protein
MFDWHLRMMWGRAVATHGLLSAYTWDHYPLAWALYGVTYGLARDVGISFPEALKGVTLLFDIANLLLLGAIFRQWRARSEWALLYWLGPYFVVLDWLGYVDPQMVFFVLASLAIMGSEPELRRFALAGIPLAVALLMKPQALVLAAVVLGYAIVRFATKREMDGRAQCAVALLCPGLLAFVAFSGAFTAAGRSPVLLASTYLHPPRYELSIAGQMPNIWYPLKALYSQTLHPGLVIRRPLFFYVVAALLTAAVLFSGVRAVARCSEPWRARFTILVLFVVGTVTLAMVFSSADENHFFLAAILGTLLCVRLRSLIGMAAMNVSLALQTVNLLGLFGVGGPPASAPPPVHWLVQNYSSEILLGIACANVLVVGVAVIAVSRRLLEMRKEPGVTAGAISS